MANLNTAAARRLLQEFRFGELFIEELGWGAPASRKPVTVAAGEPAQQFALREISQLAGFRVYEAVAADGELPSAQSQAAVWKHVAETSHENIVIFTDPARTRSLWYWVRREQGGKKTVPRRHHYLKGQPGDLFLSKLAALFVDISELDEEGDFSITETAGRVQKALDVETVTKAFFRDFQEEHGKLLEQIHGIPDPRECRWYASVLLHRLMFVWFLQEKLFLDGGERDYLPKKLAAAKAAGAGNFFSHFLRDLFFEGFAKPASRRQPIGSVPLGEIPYLNGGLFLPHGIEQRTEGQALLTARYAKIRVPDSAFADLFALFRRYSWSLDDTPGGDDREINPDVLGYIFEKYINQKEFGAYYTRPEITEYLCEQTIHQLVLDRANAGLDSAPAVHPPGSKGFRPPRKFTALDDLLFHADGPTCGRLLQEVLPRLSLLDPACGSGAFLVAAQKTLLNLYTALIGRCESLGHQPILKWMAVERAKHKAPAAYWLKKKIVTENLYGVDIMEEAVEIAKLRLFLSLVASAEARDQLEPLPNIEFNLLAGNSLIGLLHVDATAFDGTVNGAAGQERIAFEQRTGADELGMSFTSKTAPTTKEKVGAFVAAKRSSRYAAILADKNEAIALYKKHGFASGEVEGLTQDERLLNLRAHIEKLRRESYEQLNSLLLDEFRALDIQFHQATWDAAKKKDGKPEKRPLKLEDIRALQPFHWAYEFDEILVKRGGFDAIITNPPWENFKPDDKEFFMPLAEGVSKNKMRLEDFLEQKAEVLDDDPEVRAQYLAYLSRFPHVNLWFRNSAQYENQTAIVNGKKATTDLNLYKLFLEQTLHLLHAGGYCGIVIPGGIYSDLGATRLRQMLFEKTRITGLFGFENRKEIFENVHRSFKFVVLTFRPGYMTTKFPAAFMRHDVNELATFPNEDSIRQSTELVRKLSPDSLSLMEFASPLDVTIATKMGTFPLLGERLPDRWNFSLTREFHMKDDNEAGLFETEPGRNRLVLLTGKMFHQFLLTEEHSGYWVDEQRGRKALAGESVSAKALLDYQSYRWVYRRIARNTDTRTLISTIAPKMVFTEVNSPTLDLKESGITLDQQLFLCALANSFTVEWNLRLKVSSTLNYFYIYQLPIPRLTAADVAFRPLVERAARLVGTSAEFDDLLREVFGPKATHRTHGATEEHIRRTLRAELDALVAQLYALTEEEFTHILVTFPLVDESVRTLTRNTYRTLLRTGTMPT